VGEGGIEPMDEQTRHLLNEVFDQPKAECPCCGLTYDPTTTLAKKWKLAMYEALGLAQNETIPQKEG